jgi:hypothetical protein
LKCWLTGDGDGIPNYLDVDGEEDGLRWYTVCGVPVDPEWRQEMQAVMVTAAVLWLAVVRLGDSYRVQEEPPPSRPKEPPAAQVCGERNQASSSYFRNDFCEQKTRGFFYQGELGMRSRRRVEQTKRLFFRSRAGQRSEDACGEEDPRQTKSRLTDHTRS